MTLKLSMILVASFAGALIVGSRSEASAQASDQLSSADVGKRRDRTNVSPDISPTDRLSNRMQTRLQTRINNRLTRGVGTNSSFKLANDQAQKKTSN